ncbi:MAG: ATP-binding protein [Candidatus Methanogaster sp.]|uniref:ATP-binding protein n=1 Tax=Candidatus Methanogaster sp. TaxID=3386292 RepID=A0AC61L2C6_9EURY|nr:MAG: ATP-binding protein [ANME-2 cluster archaeon]
MRRIEFYNREKETMELARILSTDPTLVTFIYGPINSGKTELITNLIKTLPKSQKVFYINLRGRFISNYDEFIKVLFDVEHEARYERIKEFLKPVVNVLPESYSGIPIPKDLFLKLFKEKEVEDAFVYIETVIRAFYKDDYPPVLVIDELQVIGDLKVDDLLIYKLFNFFVRLTKELHLAHVFVASSDSLFIEQVYSEAMLEGRCRYLLVDDFDCGTTMDFLDEYGFTDVEKEVAWDYCGGKPIYLVELINTEENRKEKAEEMLGIRIGQIEGLIEDAREFGYKLSYGEERIVLDDAHILKSLEEFRDLDYIKASELSKSVKLGLIKANILFLDSVKQIIKPQSRLDLLAIREVIADA